MYDKIELLFHATEERAWLDPRYFNAGGDATQKQKGKSFHWSLKMSGYLQVYTEGGMLCQHLVIRYSGRGQCKDVYSVILKKPDGSDVQAVMKVMASGDYSDLKRDVEQALDPLVEGMMPEQYGLYEDVPVYTVEGGKTQRRRLDHRVCVQLEAYCGEDVAVQFDNLLRGQGQDRIDKALDLWSGAIRFWLDWQLAEGGGKREKYNFLLDMHKRNICRLGFV